MLGGICTDFLTDDGAGQGKGRDGGILEPTGVGGFGCGAYKKVEIKRSPPLLYLVYLGGTRFNRDGGGFKATQSPVLLLG